MESKEEVNDEIESGSEEDNSVGEESIESKEEKREEGKKGKKKNGWLLNKKKALASKASTSSMGPSILKRVVDKETMTLLKTLKVIVKKESGEKEASNMNKDITKIAVKIVILHQDKKLSDQQFQSLEFSFRRICSTFKNAFRVKQLDEATATRIHGHIKSLETLIKEMISPFVSKNTEERLKRIIDYLSAVPFIMKLPSYPEEYKTLIITFDHYLVSME
eukprot:TRINITY_DN1766_c0_g1_i1.p2 TRINITY_DN1766_c0_g1~~TRINITY_DN1766_c0_g1_i1.p2  ORF type:complete len:220 (-),score=73.79 TRINITY_DN1766_c0_g1_i1:121-780(-)